MIMGWCKKCRKIHDGECVPKVEKPYCRDCKHVRTSFWAGLLGSPYTNAMCAMSCGDAERNLVTGGVIEGEMFSCASMRAIDSACGSTASLFSRKDK